MKQRTKIAVAAGALGAVMGVVTMCNAKHIHYLPPIEEQNRTTDSIRLAMIAAYVRAYGESIRTVGGQLDVYRLVRPHTRTDGEIATACTNARSGVGPTTAEIRAGDYRNFPYARIGTAFDPKDKHGTAILWDGSPQPDGQRLVALDDGRIRWVPEAEFAAFLAAHSH